MREILFRGKAIGCGGEWVYGSYLPKSKTICNETVEKGTTLYADIFVKPESVGQFTGLTDKNGKRIFEGDICKHRSNYSGEYIISVVTFTDGQFWAMASENSGFNLSDKLEVIGNKWDNPELISNAINAD